MSTPIGIPQLGWEMQEGTLVEWLVEDGSTVAAGDPIYVLETDKTETEVEASIGGVIRITGIPGDVYAVGDQIAMIE
jgi:pyruvate/2-oxoglutarate dehydrogenase complex dihydrolipoamide acyltransferase (E2) component